MQQQKSMNFFSLNLIIYHRVKQLDQFFASKQFISKPYFQRHTAPILFIFHNMTALLHDFSQAAASIRNAHLRITYNV